MINPKYYDSKTGKLLASYAWQRASNEQLNPEAHQKAAKYAASFIEHPTIDPFEAYTQKFDELTGTVEAAV